VGDESDRLAAIRRRHEGYRENERASEYDDPWVRREFFDYASSDVGWLLGEIERLRSTVLEIRLLDVRSPTDVRNPTCVERWPECASGEYDPRCCRFPKSCSV
jgi:hypothetical protein